MIYSIDISSDGVITENISDDLYLRKDFTLTVKAVNDAPIVLHPLEELYLIGDAAMVLSTFYYNVEGDIMNYNKDFTLTVKAVNDAPIVLHPLEELYLTGDAAMVLNHV